MSRESARRGSIGNAGNRSRLLLNGLVTTCKRLVNAPGQGGPGGERDDEVERTAVLRGHAVRAEPPTCCGEGEGWITKDNAQEVRDSTGRGIFLPARHALFFYRGIGFFFDAGVVTEASRWAEEIMSALALDQHVEVQVGPPDAVIHGTEYRQERLGTIESVTADRRTTQSSGRASRAADRER
jgi:hypothetical protein